MQVFRETAKTSKISHLWLGSILWILNIQYFITQFFVGLGWSKPFSLLHNTISDLGNTTCGLYRDSFVCSPAHSWMNVSFVMLGISMSLGSILIYHQYVKNAANAIGFSFLVLAGLGTALVGIFPENTVSALHIVGAALPFSIGNLALVILGLALQMPHALRYYTVTSGLVALIALVLFLTHNYLGFGIGGIERLVAYPQTIWMIVFGAYSLHRYCKLRSDAHGTD